MRTRIISESQNVRNRERQFAWQYDKIYFLKAVVSFIHWMKHFPDSPLQHLVPVLRDFGVSDPSFWRYTYLIEAVLYLNARRLKSSTGLSVKTQAPTILATNRPFSRDNQLFHLQIRHDSEWLTGWTFVNKEKLHKTIYVGRVQHMRIFLLTKIRIFSYQNVLWISTEYNWVFYSRLKPLSEPTGLEILKPLWDVQKKPNWHFDKKTQVLFWWGV